tara:strand:+ start:184 stop:360 length:177 start_codon:yes stop_codon:yes gene_type:complete
MVVNNTKRNMSDTIKEWTEIRSRKKAIKMLELMLEWSDRIGSDEMDEIKSIISILKNN